MADQRTRGSRAIPDEALRRALMADSECGLLLADPAARVAALNPAGARILARTPGSAAGLPVADVLTTLVPGADPVRDGLRSARTEREDVLVTARGAEIPVLLRTWRVGQPPWVLISFRDLTQPRRMREELRRNERLATLGQLSAGVAHEIRNPLAGIGTSAQVLLRRFEPRDERSRFVSVILEEVARLDRIVTSLLQYARPRVPELREQPLARCIERVLELEREHLESAGIRVEVIAASRLAPLWIDPDLVSQVIQNVTQNAIQAMPKGGSLRYEVRAVRRRRGPRGPGRRASDHARDGRDAGWMRYQQVRVTDSGPGIPRGVMAKMFDPFFTTRPRGTGLGLSISQTILQEHGGSIEVASREGKGTTVLLNFPTEKRHGERRSGDARIRHAADR